MHMLLIHSFFSSQPWIFTEIKEQRHWDISSGERFNILKDFVRFGFQHWGSDSKGLFTNRCAHMQYSVD